MAPRMGNALDPTAVTAMAVVVVDDWIKTVPSTPTLSPTQGFAAKANILCAASPLSPAKPRLIMLTAQISRYISPAVPHQPRALVHTGSWIPSAWMPLPRRVNNMAGTSTPYARPGQRAPDGIRSHRSHSDHSANARPARGPGHRSTARPGHHVRLLHRHGGVPPVRRAVAVPARCAIQSARAQLRRSRPSRHGDQRARGMITGTVDLVREDN